MIWEIILSLTLSSIGLTTFCIYSFKYYYLEEEKINQKQIKEVLMMIDARLCNIQLEENEDNDEYNSLSILKKELIKYKK